MKILIEVYDFDKKSIIPARVIILKDNKSLFNWYEGYNGIYINGKEKFNLKRGKYSIKISAGNEYTEVNEEIEIYSNRGYKFYLKRIVKMSEIGWWTGEGHSHIYRGNNKNINYEKIYIMMKAEGYNFLMVGAPINQREEELYRKYKKEKVEYKRKKIENEVRVNRKKQLLLLKRYERLNFYFLNGLEAPKCRFGHLWWFDYPIEDVPFKYFDDSYDKWQFNRERDDEPAPQFYIYEFIKKIKDKNKEALAVYAHPVSWWWYKRKFITNIAAELLFDTYAGPVYDGISIMSYDADNRYAQALWYKVLNMGYKIPGFAEMDICFTSHKMNENRFFKTYYYTGNKNFSYREIIESAKAGRSFITSGPFLFFTVNSKLPGEVFQLTKKNNKFKFSIRVLNKKNISRVELIKNGKIIKRWHPDKQEFNIEFQMKVNRYSWFIVKCYGQNINTQVAITNPIYFEEKEKVKEISKFVKVVLKNYIGYAIRIGDKKINITNKKEELNIPLLSTIEIIKSGKIVFSKKVIEFEDIYQQIKFLYNGKFVNKRLKSGEIPLKYFKIKIPTIVLKNTKISK